LYVVFGVLTLTRIYSAMLYSSNSDVGAPSSSSPSSTLAMKKKNNKKKNIASFLHTFAWFICAAATVVPARLLEFRYFSIPVATMMLLIWGNFSSSTNSDHGSSSGDYDSWHQQNPISQQQPLTGIANKQRRRGSTSNNSSSMASTTSNEETVGTSLSTPLAHTPTRGSSRRSGDSRKELITSSSISSSTSPSSNHNNNSSSSSHQDLSIDGRVYAAAIAVALNVMVTAFTSFIFLYRPYTWGDGRIARRMW
jgi:hypothetical protein